MKFLVFLFLSFFVVAQNAYSWGSRGHNSICASAPHLVKNESLKTFLRFRLHTIGHLCNIPDIYWKSLGSEASELGNPTHYIDPEILGLKVSEVPLDIKANIEKYTGRDNPTKPKSKIFSVATEVGTLWWRADQFFRMISDLKTVFPNTISPKNFKEEQDEKLPYNLAVYNFTLYMGLLGHFVGDASQPFHSTVDFDGYAQGHGGIHSFYEEQIVAYFGPDMDKLVVDKAKIIKDKKLTTGTPLEIMRYLSTLAHNDIDDILKLDPVSKKSEIKNEKGMEIRTAAVRASTEVGFNKLKDLLVMHLARATIVLAHLWDESYHNAGSPSLQSYKSFKYPHNLEFIAPDYISKTEPKK